MGRKARKKVKTKSKRQVRFLFSAGSALTGKQMDKLAGEIRTGHVKVEKRKT